MTWTDSAGLGEVPLSQLVGLNEEIAALVRTGIPLERGLLELSRELPGRPGAVARSLASRLQNGETLEQILADDRAGLPKLWRAVVAAGIRSGNLAAALESMTRTGRRVGELRRSLVLAAIYPTLVLVVAYCLLLMVSSFLFPRLMDFYADLGEPAPVVLTQFQDVVSISSWLAPIALLVLGFWCLTAGQRSVPARRLGNSRFGWARPVLQTLQDGRIAAYVEVLRLLVKQNVPLPEAMELAGDASGDSGLHRASLDTAKRLRDGEIRSGTLPREFPPLLGWVLLSGQDRPRLGRTLQIIADKYRHRAARSAAVVSIYAPVIFTALFGGMVVLVQALIILGPVWQVFHELGKAL